MPAWAPVSVMVPGASVRLSCVTFRSARAPVLANVTVPGTGLPFASFNVAVRTRACPEDRVDGRAPSRSRTEAAALTTVTARLPDVTVPEPGFVPAEIVSVPTLLPVTVNVATPRFALVVLGTPDNDPTGTPVLESVTEPV